MSCKAGKRHIKFAHKIVNGCEKFSSMYNLKEIDLWIPDLFLVPGWCWVIIKASFVDVSLLVSVVILTSVTFVVCVDGWLFLKVTCY